MRKTLFATPLALAAAATLIASPASAAPGHRDDTRGGLRSEINQLDRKIDRLEQRRLITRTEANRLDRKVKRLEDQLVRYARNGLTRAEIRLINNRIETVDRQIEREVKTRKLQHHNNRGYTDNGRSDRGHDRNRR